MTSPTYNWLKKYAKAEEMTAWGLAVVEAVVTIGDNLHTCPHCALDTCCCTCRKEKP